MRGGWHPAVQRRNGHAEVLGHVLGRHPAGQQLLGRLDLAVGHLRLAAAFATEPPDEQPWPPRTPDRQKKSNTYLVYAQHLWNPDRYSILAVVTPAHDLMSAANTQLISHFSACAEDFHNR
ncbi:hypothetical protein ID988_004118 [Salmonella enterica]|nr:hypothetical protein [Salmonella enterica]